MKRNIFILLLLPLFLNACSDDGPVDYPELEEISIKLDKELYTGAIGDVLTIEPEVSGEIPADDLSYFWEVGHGEGYGDHTAFTPVFEGRRLELKCELGPLFPAPGTYTLRVRAKQNSLNRDFYSSHFKLKLTGQTGLMALYGAGGQSDIALIRNFTESECTVKDDFYSRANGGEKIPGTGRFLTQLQGGSVTFGNYHSVIAVTDLGNAGANYLTMEAIPGGWNAMLFKGGFNRGIPENIVYASDDPMIDYQDVYIIDGGEIYGRQNSEFVLRPAIGTSENAYINTYDLAPYVFPARESNYRVWLFDRKSRGFVGVTNPVAVFLNGAAHAGSVAKVFTPGGAFNPSRMRADLEFMSGGGEPGHLMAVMKRDNGERFLADINTTPAEMSQTAEAVYPLDLSTIGEVLGYDFCPQFPSRACCYAYTSGNIYRLNAGGSAAEAVPQAVEWPEDAALAPGETITAMKTLLYEGRPLMAVGTWNGTEGMVRVYSVDPSDGAFGRLCSSAPLPGQIAAFCLKHI